MLGFARGAIGLFCCIFRVFHQHVGTGGGCLSTASGLIYRSATGKIWERCVAHKGGSGEGQGSTGLRGTACALVSGKTVPQACRPGMRRSRKAAKCTQSPLGLRQASSDLRKRGGSGGFSTIWAIPAEGSSSSWEGLQLGARDQSLRNLSLFG